jgi:DNA-binding transcriptional LysR family regulator
MPSRTQLSVALECDEVDVLKDVALASDAVLAAPHAAVEQEIAAGTLVALSVAGLSALYSEMGVVTLRGRTPSPMAELIMNRLPSAGPNMARHAEATPARPKRPRAVRRRAVASR